MTRPNHPAPGRGWQATPGQPIPRAARQPAANGLLLVMLVLVWFSPLSIMAWLVGQAVILLQRRWHWWRFTLASLAGIGVVLAVTGPEEALRRHIRRPDPGRVILGRSGGLGGRLLAAEDSHSVLVFGPPGSFKTAGVVIPAILEWAGPVLATSVKPDVIKATRAHRERRGEVVVLDPLASSGLAGARWTPLAFCRSWPGAQQLAATIAHTADLGTLGTAEHKYWKTLGQKLLAPLLFAAARDDRSMAEVLRWVDLRDAASTPQPPLQWESGQARTRHRRASTDPRVPLGRGFPARICANRPGSGQSAAGSFAPATTNGYGHQGPRPTALCPSPSSWPQTHRRRPRPGPRHQRQLWTAAATRVPHQPHGRRERHKGGVMRPTNQVGAAALGLLLLVGLFLDSLRAGLT
jgi:Type IV secretory system Conjugative DNA transfer